MMASIHFLRGFINDYQGTWEGGLRYILESAPVFFFIAFGMTALHSVSGPRKWRRLLELGIISLLHQGYLMEITPFKFDFLLFLWFMYVVIFIFRRLFLNGFFRFVLLAGILITNLLIRHEKFGTFGGHPFGPMPWAFCVIVGMTLGLETQTEKQKIRLAIIGIALIVCAYLIRMLAPNLGLTPISFEFSKWKPTTSTYLLLWNGIAICVYCLFGYMRLPKSSIFVKFIRTLSVYLLQGTVFHYLTNSAAIKIFFQGGYSTDVVLPLPILIAAILAVSLAIYIAISIAFDLRLIVISYLISDRNLYRLGWIIAILISIVVIVLSIMNRSSALLWVLSMIGMLIAAFAFMNTEKFQSLL